MTAGTSKRDFPTPQHPEIPTSGRLQQPEPDLCRSREEQMVWQEGALGRLSPWAGRNVFLHPGVGFEASRSKRESQS